LKLGLFLDEGKPMTELLQHAVSKKIHFLEVNRLLAAFGSEQNKSTSMPTLIEPLTDD
jgi:hypothetical protein